MAQITVTNTDASLVRSVGVVGLCPGGRDGKGLSRHYHRARRMQLDQQCTKAYLEKFELDVGFVFTPRDAKEERGVLRTRTLAFSCGTNTLQCSAIQLQMIVLCAFWALLRLF